MKPKLKLMGRKTSSTLKKKKLGAIKSEQEADALLLWLTEKIMIESTIHGLSNTKSNYVFKGNW